MPGIDETESSYRVRQIPSSHFIQNSFRTINITDGIDAVVGKLKPEYASKSQLDDLLIFDFELKELFRKKLDK